jgi:hypothetical protein
MARLPLFKRRSPKEARGVAADRASNIGGAAADVLHEGWAQHGEPLTRPLPTVVPGADRDMPGPPPTPVIGTAPDLCLFKPDGDHRRI